MKKIILAVVVLSLVSSSFATEVAGWNTFVIRNNGTTSPAINDVVKDGVAAKEFVINMSSMKAAWGTDAISGAKVGQITELTIDRLDNYSRFTAGSGPAVAPYFNIWITDGAGKYAVIANEPSNAEWVGDAKWNITSWNMLSTKTVKVYETLGASNALTNPNTSWVHQLVGKTSLKFSDLANFTIMAPSAAELAAGWTGLGTGAPRQLGTNNAYAFNWMFGDTLANYVSDPVGYIVANPTAVPEPCTMAVLGLGGLFLARRNK